MVTHCDAKKGVTVNCQSVNMYCCVLTVVTSLTIDCRATKLRRVLVLLHGNTLHCHVYHYGLARYIASMMVFYIYTVLHIYC